MNNEILENVVNMDKNSLAYDIILKDKQNLTLLNYQISDILVKFDLFLTKFRISHACTQVTSNPTSATSA